MMSPRTSSKKTASPKTGSRATSGSVQPSLSQNFRTPGSKLFGSFKPSGGPSIRPPTSNLRSGSRRSTRHSGQVSSEKKSSIPASPKNVGSVVRSSSSARSRTAHENRFASPLSDWSKNKSVIPSVPLSAAKRGLSRSNRTNLTGRATKSQAASMAKSGIPSRNSRHPVTWPTSSIKGTTAHTNDRSVHIHHHHQVIAAPPRAKIMIVQPHAYRPSPTVACHFCHCDIDDVTYSQSRCCFDCGTTRGYDNDSCDKHW